MQRSCLRTVDPACLVLLDSKTKKKQKKPIPISTTHTCTQADFKLTFRRLKTIQIWLDRGQSTHKDHQDICVTKKHKASNTLRILKSLNLHLKAKLSSKNNDLGNSLKLWDKAIRKLSLGMIILKHLWSKSLLLMRPKSKKTRRKKTQKM